MCNKKGGKLIQFRPFMLWGGIEPPTRRGGQAQDFQSRCSTVPTCLPTGR